MIRSSISASVVALAVTVTSLSPTIASAQTAAATLAPQDTAAQTASAAGSAVPWRPAVSVGIGKASTGGELQGAATALVVAVRAILAPHLAAEVEWTSRERYASSFVGRSYLNTLNGQVGEVGQVIRDSEETARSHAVNILGRTTVGRASPFAGMGVAWFRRTERSTSSKIGCTGPWVPTCYSNRLDVSEQSGIRPQLLGGIDVDLAKWIQVYADGRMTSWYGRSLLAGVRLAVLPERRAPTRVGGESASGVVPGSMAGVRTGQRVWVTTTDGMERVGTLLAISAGALTMSVESNEVTVLMPAVRHIEKPDPIIDGAGWGILVGAGVGLALLTSNTDDRTLPATVLLGGAVGGILDGLRNGRRLVYSAPVPAITVAPVLAPGRAAVGVRVSWR